jgi:hypothetical protein
VSSESKHPKNTRDAPIGVFVPFGLHLSPCLEKVSTIKELKILQFPITEEPSSFVASSSVGAHCHILNKKDNYSANVAPATF